MSEQFQVVPHEGTQKVSEALLAKLRTVPILSSLTDEELHCLEDVEELHLAKGDHLARQGEAAHYFWILLDGEVEIYQTLADGRDVSLTTMPSGYTFGELPLLANIPNAASLRASKPCHLMQLNEESFWSLMTSCPDVRKAILGNMAARFQKLQSVTVQQEKMASLGTLAAGLMHELNNPGSAARRAASQLRDNLLRMHELTAQFSRITMSAEQKQCMFDLQDQALSVKQPLVMNSLAQSDAEESLAEWMEAANVENAWKMAPTLVSIGMDASKLECARAEFTGTLLSSALSWLEALVSSMQLVNTIEESIGRVTDLVYAVKTYAYEGNGQRQTVDINNSIHATLLILGHKIREKEIVLKKNFAEDLPQLRSDCSGLNQIWTNLLDNAIDAVPQHGQIGIRTWAEKTSSDSANPHTDLCISVSDNGSGIPSECQLHIFDPFYTTKPVGVGTGIGLGIVHRIVEQYGGTIRFASEPGSTEFVVRLPSEKPKPGSADKTSA
ncbi:MAG TPA: ATP-binding protein [Edaphobacter sp.]|jgi:signal transduction histidine kinase|nr:ATP-binding protein [Edaphobacter sp.]